MSLWVARVARALAVLAVLLVAGAVWAQSPIVGRVLRLAQLTDRARLYIDYPKGTTLAQLGLVAKGDVVVTPVTVTPPPPPPVVLPIWGAVDATVLGNCLSAAHDQWTLDGGDGYRYRTWHPQVDPSGCVYAHEHGDDPNGMRDTWVRANWRGLFGYAGRRMAGHEEAHEGFKVFLANVGDTNDEGRVNMTASLSTFHMGTGGPRRFVTQHHSNELVYRYQAGSPYAATHLMMDTGGTSDVCDPRTAAPTKDALTLQNRCRVNSPYEIWSAQQSIMDGDREVYRAFATPAVFDPITVFDRANPTAVVYAWDARVDAIKNFPDDWSGHRGCDRESYAQVGYFYASGGPTTYYTTPMGTLTLSTAADAILQIVAPVDVIGLASTQDNLQFKVRRGHCANIALLGLKN